MAPQSVPGLSAPPHLTLPPGVMEYLSMLAKNDLLPPVPANQTTAPPAPPTSTPGVALPSEGRTFTRVGRGQGGELVDKQKASKEIKAPSRKQKSLVEPDVEMLLPSTPTPTTKNTGKKSTAKRLKTVKVGYGSKTISLLMKPKHSPLSSQTRSYRCQSRLKAPVNLCPHPILALRSLPARYVLIVLSRFQHFTPH